MDEKMKIHFVLIILFIMVMFFAFDAGGEEKNETRDSEHLYIHPELVFIKGGEFVMGKKHPKPNEKNKKNYVNNPIHRVFVDSFYIDKYEVTNYQYFLFCKATGRRLPVFWGMAEVHCGLDFPNHPVVGVSYLDALAYARWQNLRLPTEAEWEYAARGGLVGKKFPHGDELNKKMVNYGQNLQGTTQVGSFPANGYGLFDMAGNVREWVFDYYQTGYYLDSSYKNPRGPEIGRFRVIRGGSWFSGPGCVTVFRRNALASNWVDFAVGFRCARDFESKRSTINKGGK